MSNTRVLTVLSAHGLVDGTNVTITRVQGMTSVNGFWQISAPNAYFFSMPAVPNAAWTGGGVSSGGGMALYDPETLADAFTALGRNLAEFDTQNDDPTINGGADATFLANRMMSHFTTLITYIQGLYPGAAFELLWPHDVTYSPLYWNVQWPYAQGGRLNRQINWPAGMEARGTSGFDRLKMEALSWGASYRSLDLAKAEQAWPQLSPNNQPVANTAGLVPWFNGGCPWTLEYVATVNAGIPLIVFWAYDHLGLLSWPWPLPNNSAKAGTT